MSNYFDNKSAFLEPTVTQYGSSMVMTNVNKPRKTKYVNIDTKFTDDYSRKANNKNDHYSVTFPERINEVRSMTVTQIEIPITFNNVCLSLGNSNFGVQNQTTQQDVIVSAPDGHYSGFDTPAYLQNLPSELDFTMDANKVITLSNLSVSTSYKINFAIDGSGNFDKFSLKSKLGWLLGFRRDFYIVGPNERIVAESSVDCRPVRYLYLVLDEFTNSFPNSFISFFTHSAMNKKIIAKIALGNSSSFGTVLTGNEKNGILVSDNRLYNSKIDVQRLNIQLVNEWGKVVDLNGLDFSFLLKIEHE